IESFIGFNTVTTKALTSQYPTTVPFRSTAFSYEGTWSTTEKASSTRYIDDQLVKYNSTYSYWITYDSSDQEHQYSWPGGSTRLTFFSYSPASLSGTATVTTDGVGISSWDVKTQTGDILVADIAEDKTRNESLAGYTGVPTYFKHKLTRIVFRFGIASDATEETQVKITSISLKDVYSSGTYSRGGYSDDSWTGVNLESSWTLKSYEYGLVISRESLSDDLEFNMIPQMLTKGETTHPILEIGYKSSIDDGTTWEDKTASCFFDENLRQDTWEKGKKYIYTIYIGVGQYPIVLGGSVDDWGAGDISEITVG
ncbi:MAG: fimbrillin family protein, partial [Candidatus Cryptobacteroides sp.]